MEVAIHAIRTRAGKLAREDGVALPVAIAVVSLTLLLANVALIDVLSAGDSANRDRRAKRAIQAADAGIDAAIWRRNQVEVTAANPCVSYVGGALAAVPALAPSGGESWCPAISEDLGTRASYSYQVKISSTSPPKVEKVVSTGTVDGVSRRASVETTPGEVPLFPDGGVHAISAGRDFSGSTNSSVYGSVRTNRNVSLTTGAKVCGNVTYGPSPGTGPGSSNCGYPVAQASAAMEFANFDLPALPPSTETNNARVCGTAPGDDTCTGNSWNATTRRLTINTGQTVTLRGGIYRFCRLRIQNTGRLILAPASGKPTRIYIDPPQSCQDPAADGRFSIQNAATIELGASGALLALLVGGSDTSDASNPHVQFVNDSSNGIGVPVAVYAPKSTVALSNSANFSGGLAARDVTMANSTVSLTYDPRIKEVTTEGNVKRLPGGYRECTRAPTGSSPASGC